MSLKVYISAPTRPDASMAISFEVVSSSQVFITSLRVRCVMVQNRNMMVTALSRALIVLTMRATIDGSLTKWVKRLAVSMKKGAPGGWPISSLYPVVINSGQSQNEAVGSMVEQ